MVTIPAHRSHDAASDVSKVSPLVKVPCVLLVAPNLLFLPKPRASLSRSEVPVLGSTWTLTHLPWSPRFAWQSPVDFLNARSTTWDNLPVVLTGVWVSITRWSLAAASDLPQVCSKFNFFICRRIVAIARCFVMRSTVFSSPVIFVKGTIFLAHCSCNHRQLTSMWRTLAMP